MAVANSTGVIASRSATPTRTPSRHLLAAGIITRRSGRTVTITRTASGTTGTVLPVRTPGASNPPKPSTSPPVAFLTASKAPADLDDMAGWTVADFETLQILDETTQPLPAAVVSKALANIEATLARWEADEQLRVEAELELVGAEL